MKSALKAVLTASLIFAASVNIFAFENMNRQIGIIYLKNAAAAYLVGDFTAAGYFIDKTEEFYEFSSDVDYIKGLIVRDRDNDINQAEILFKKAVEKKNWILFEKKDCISNLALIQFRKKDYTDLIGMIENEAFPDYNDNDLMYLYLLSLQRAGADFKYTTALQKSLLRYPDDYRFALLNINESESYRNKVISGKLRFKNSEGGLQVLLKAAFMMKDGQAKIETLKNYFSKGGDAPEAYIEYYRLRGGITEEEFRKLISGSFFETPSNRQRLENILTSNEMRAELNDAWAGYTGNVYYDYNGDGFFEELHLFDTGMPAGISIDMDQDGIVEVMLVFEKGLPAELINFNGRNIDIVFENYPAVAEVSIADGRKKNVYTLLRDKMELEVYRERPEDGRIEYLADNVNSFINDESVLSDNSVRVTSYNNTGGGAYNSIGEDLERRDEYFSILKTYNETNGNFIYQQFNDIKISGYGDIDYDNLIDLKQTYKDGELLSIEADENKNGIYDYKLSFEGGKSISWWDFNEDGLYDCKQYLKNGILVREYSSGFDGNFDIIERK